MKLRELLETEILYDNFRLFSVKAPGDNPCKQVGEGLRIFNRPITPKLMTEKGVDPKYLDMEILSIWGYSQNCLAIEVLEK